MEALFLKVINMSIAASWLILAVIVVRFLLQRRAPRWVNYILWAIVAVRLLCPISIESIYSLMPTRTTISEDIVYEQYPAIQSGVTIVDEVVNPVISDVFEASPENSVNPIQIALLVTTAIWMVGMVIACVYAIVSLLSLRKQVKEAVWLEDNIWQCDHIQTAFLLGMIRTRIYVPSDLQGEKLAYVIAHEKSHIKWKDQWWKMMGYILLTIHWFNPLVWLAYVLLCKDIELACDERVIKGLSIDGKKAYSEALLECSAPAHIISACPVAFGEVGVETRVKSILQYKKPAFWIAIVGVIACVVIALGFLTVPKSVTNEEVAGDYYLSGEELLEGQNIHLYDGGEFVISASMLSSYLEHGTYVIDGNIITATNDFGYVYVFRADGETLKLISSQPNVAKEDSDYPGFEIVKGSLFKKYSNNEELLVDSNLRLTSPPTLRVSVGGKEYEAWKGSYSWMSINSDGTWNGKNADASHPTSKKDALELIETTDMVAVLSFAVFPDSLTVGCWEANFLGDSLTEGEGVTCIGNLIPLKKGDYVYCVTATWENEEYEGSVTYGFYVSRE